MSDAPTSAESIAGGWVTVQPPADAEVSDTGPKPLGVIDRYTGGTPDGLWVSAEAYDLPHSMSASELMGSCITSHREHGSCEVRETKRFTMNEGAATAQSCVMEVVPEHGEAVTTAIITAIPDEAVSRRGVIVTATWPQGLDDRFLESANGFLGSLRLHDVASI